jgi:hypothetical protein
MADSDYDYDDEFADGGAIARNFSEDYRAIDRAGALLLLLKAKYPEGAKNLEIVKAKGKYVVREIGWFRSKPVPGFTLGRMVEVERQLREVVEAAGVPVTDELIDELAAELRMSPLRK